MAVDFLCIGHASYDMSVFVDEYPGENTKCETHELLEAGGGPAANAAYLISQWGGRCAFAGLAGDDRYGRQIRDEFEAAGADVSRFQLRTGHSTPVSVIVVNKQNASRTIINRKAVGAPLVVDFGETNLGPRILLFDGHELDASLAALAAFPEAIAILDAGSWRAGTADLAGRVQYLAASERFARQATGIDHLNDEANQKACIAVLRQRYGNTVIVTLGERGLIADDGHGFFHLPAFPAKAVDTTAAGDIFHGAFAWMVGRERRVRARGLQNRDEGERRVGARGLQARGELMSWLRFASMAASLSVRMAGGRASIPTLAAVEEALCHAG